VFGQVSPSVANASSAKGHFALVVMFVSKGLEPRELTRWMSVGKGMRLLAKIRGVMGCALDPGEETRGDKKSGREGVRINRGMKRPPSRRALGAQEG
jgi:hypothetical protein